MTPQDRDSILSLIRTARMALKGMREEDTHGYRVRGRIDETVANIESAEDYLSACTDELLKEETED